jgi:uncharacterized repeat protein (TIGR03803 family)
MTMRTGRYQRCISALHRLEASGALALGAMLVAAVIGAPVARAQTYTVLHRFIGADGANPEAGLLGYSAGNFYGTTYSGGASNQGVVFKLNKTGETVLYSFTGGADGGGALCGSNPRLSRQSLRHYSIRRRIGRRGRLQAGYERHGDRALQLQGGRVRARNAHAVRAGSATPQTKKSGTAKWPENGFESAHLHGDGVSQEE